MQAGVIVLVLVAVIYVFDLPKTLLITVAVIVPVTIMIHVIFPPKRKVGKKREIIFAICMFVLFCAVIFWFDLPKKLYAAMAIITSSQFVIDVLFPEKGDRNSDGA